MKIFYIYVREIERNKLINKNMNMNILDIDLNIYKQNMNPKKENKQLYGEVNTPFYLIEEMLELLPEHIFKNPNMKWLDPACGCGYFMMVIFKKLMFSLQELFPIQEKRRKYILENMLYMVEINPENIEKLKQTFGVDMKTNIYCNDFLSMNRNDFGFLDKKNKFDIIIGNPPYNSQGLKKVPTNQKMNKKQDGITIWGDFIKHSTSLLKDNGFLSMIIPSIWMKPDKMKMYDYFMQFKLHKIKCFSNTETKLIFKSQAQTPTCYFLLEKLEDMKTKNAKENHSNDIKNIFLYDKSFKKYVDYSFKLGTPIPLFGASIIKKLYSFVEKYGNINAYIKKTNMPSSKVKIFNIDCLSEIKYGEKSFPNISTCILNKQNTQNTPTLIMKYSNKKCAFYGEKKLILAHKMYGFPFFDEEGIYGICNRDNYIFQLQKDDFKNILQEFGYESGEKSISKVKINMFYLIIQHFLSTKLALFIYESTRYRMKYLEKYAFELIPNILKIPQLWDYLLNHCISNDFTEINILNKDFVLVLYDIFGFNQEEIQIIEGLHKKSYTWFV